MNKPGTNSFLSSRHSYPGHHGFVNDKGQIILTSSHSDIRHIWSSISASKLTLGLLPYLSTPLFTNPGPAQGSEKLIHVKTCSETRDEIRSTVRNNKINCSCCRGDGSVAVVSGPTNAQYGRSIRSDYFGNTANHGDRNVK